MRREVGAAHRPQMRQRPPVKWPPRLLVLAFLSFGVITIANSFVNGGATDLEWHLAVTRFGVQPALVVAWILLRLKDNRRAIFNLDAAAIPAILLVSWFALGASLSEDPIASLGRALPLWMMMVGAFCVIGPTLVTPQGIASLFRAAFAASLLLATTAVAAALTGYDPSWGLYGNRFYGPLSATTLGPVCVAGLFAGYAVRKLETSRVRTALIVVASLWLLLILILTRARGSYGFFVVGSLVIYALSSRHARFARLLCMTLVVAFVLAIAVNWSGSDLSQGRVATFLRLDQSDMLLQRSEVWAANGSFWMEHPILGVGLGNEAALSEVAKRSHSAYLSTLNEGGLAALLLLVLSLIVVGRRCLRTALSHPIAELRLLGVTALALLVGSAALGAVETTLINAASTANTFLWITAATAVVASRQRAAASNRVHPAHTRSFASARQLSYADVMVR